MNLIFEKRFRKSFYNLKDFCKNNKALLLIFFLSTFLFLYQHFSILSWDFSSYVLNGRYLFFNGSYYETFRPPTTPILLGILGIFGLLGEYLYIILVSTLFFYSSLKISQVIFKKEIENGIKKETIWIIFYFFSLGIFTLHEGLFQGTEMLALAFLELAIANMFLGKTSGLYLSLAFLTRYNFIIFFPLVFLNKNYKRILINIFTFIVPVFIWFLFNYIYFGNWFTGLSDSYANNVLFRSSISTPFSFHDLFFVIGIFLVFFVIGLILFVYKATLSKRNFLFSCYIDLFFFFMFIFVLIDYSKIPLKNARYLFNLVLPIAYFSTRGLISLMNIKSFKLSYLFKWLRVVLVLVFIVVFLITFSYFEKDKYYQEQFYSAAKDIKNLGLERCEILSPFWVPMNYLSGNVYPLGRNDISDSLNRNKIVLIFKNEVTIDDQFKLDELSNFTRLKDTENYMFLTKNNFDLKKCSQKIYL